MSVHPYGLPLMLDAWMGCVSWAAGANEIAAQFIEQTGWVPPRNGLEAMIDEACGRKAATFAQFCDWVTIHLWGEDGDDQDIDFGTEVK